jgi:hypothetical protein
MQSACHGRSAGTRAWHVPCIIGPDKQRRGAGVNEAIVTRRREKARSREQAGAVPADLDRLARFLDSSIRLPGNLRIGFDGLIGLIPGIGDAVGAMFSFYIISRASALGVSRAVLARMFVNVALDTLVGAVPIFGDMFDFAFKSNLRNMALIQRYMADARRERRSSWLLLGGIVLAFVLLAAAVVALGILFARLIASAF